MLRMPRKTTDEDRRARVSSTVSLLSLTKCTKRIIGRLSGGERKRLAFATVLILDPPVVLIDEPTSGLDAYLAKSVIYIIRAMATEQRRTIVVVLHQPTSEMYNLMDSICLITHGGRLSFLGRRHDATDYFANDCKLAGSSLDNYIEQLAIPPDTEFLLKQSQMVADCFTDSRYALAVMNEINKQYDQGDSDAWHLPEEQWRSSMWRQFKWLMWRANQSGARDPVRTINVIIRSIGPAIIFGLIYFHLAHSSKYDQNIQSLSYAILNVTMMTSNQLILGTLPGDIPVYIKETRRRIYRTLPYYAICMLRDLPLILLVSFVFATVVYWLADISNNFIHYISFIGIVLLTSNAGAAFASFISSFSTTIESAIAFSVPIQQTFNIFSGFFIALPSVPRFFLFIPFIAPIYYGFTSAKNLEKTWKNENQNKQCKANTITNSKNGTFALDLWCDQKENENDLALTNEIYFHIIMLFVLYIVYHSLAFAIIWYRGNRYRLKDYWFKKTNPNDNNLK